MSALNKMMGFLGLVDTEEVTAIEEAPIRRIQTVPATREKTGVTVVGANSTANSTVNSIATQSDESSSAYNIVTLQPRSYSEARKVGEYYREGNPVIINLDDMEEAERKRLVDFASGLVFGLNGKIERISLKVFLLSPANIKVSNEDKSAFVAAPFYNQS